MKSVTFKEIFNQENPHFLTPWGDDINMTGEKVLVIMEHSESWEGSELKRFKNINTWNERKNSFILEGWKIQHEYEITD